MKEENQFGYYIEERLRSKNISKVALCQGICDVNYIFRLKRQISYPSKIIQDRLLGRLGIIAESFENIVFFDEYERWKQMQEISELVNMEKYQKALEKIENYVISKKQEKKIELQFLYFMKSIIYKNLNHDKKEIFLLVKKALQCTVQLDADNSIEGKVLALEELSIYADYLFYGAIENKELLFSNLLDYINNLEWDTLALAKIIPKVTWYSLSIVDIEKLKSKEDYYLKIQQEAIEILGHSGKIFYLYELLEMNLQSTQYLNLKKTIERIYRKKGLYPYTSNDCYLYDDQEVYCIGDIIRNRRKMQNITMHELCDGICDERTLNRLENNKLHTSRYIVGQLFVKLKLPNDFCRSSILTRNHEDIELLHLLQKAINNFEYEEAKTIIDQLEKDIDLNVICNKQLINRYRAVNEWMNAKLSNEEFIIELKKIITLSIDNNMSDKHYFTNEELSCFQNLLLAGDDEYKDFLKNHCYELGTLGYHSMYMYIMCVVSQNERKHGNYLTAYEINNQIIELVLRKKDMSYYQDGIYEMYMLENAINIPYVKNNQDIEVFEDCMIINYFMKNMHDMHFFEEKLQSVIRNKIT